MENITHELVSIIIVNYNGSQDTIECVNSLEKITNVNYNVIIVDNASRPDQCKMLYELSSEKVTIIESDTNLGFAGGNNIGIKHAIKNGAQYVCLLNNDTIVNQDFLQLLLDKLTSDVKIGAVCPMILDFYNRDRVTYGGGEINYLKGGCYIHGVNSYDERIINTSRQISFAHGCCMLIRRDVFDIIGLLPEEYFLYYEDTDYSIRITNANYMIWYVPEAKIWHKESVSTCKGSDNFQYYFTRNRLLFIRKNFPIKYKITAYPITFLYLIKKILQKKFDFRPPVEGIRDFMRKKYGKRI